MHFSTQKTVTTLRNGKLHLVVSTENDVTLSTITNFDLHDMSHYKRDRDWLQTQDQVDRCLDIY